MFATTREKSKKIKGSLLLTTFNAIHAPKIATAFETDLT
jgi:hypothetical protein